jgi:hypothetical protein
MKIGIVGATYEMDARSFDVQRTVNQFPIASEVQGSKEVSALRGVAGYSLFTTIGGGSIRGIISPSNNRCFAVSGYELYEIFSNGTSTLRGTLLTGAVRVSMAENGTQLIIVDGTYGYILDMGTNIFTQITDVDFPACDIVEFQDGYFIVPEKNTRKFYISALYDGFTWDALDFTTVDGNPDNLVSLISDSGNLWLFGDRSVEVWSNTGNALFPFERISGAIINTGCAAAQTVQKFDNTIAWLGVDTQGRGVVWKANGYSAQRLSNQAIEAKIATAVDFTESYAWVYHEQGHVFYCLQVKGLNTTLVYDGATGMWHERQFYNSATSTYEQHRGSCHTFFAQKNIIGDRITGDLYSQSLNEYSYNGEEIRRIRVCPHLQDEKRNIPYSALELDMETAVGNDNVTDPQIMMQYSDDGGNTWSNEKWVSVGKIGKYKTKVRWSRLGSARNRVFKIMYSEKTFYQVNGAYLNAY